MVAACGYSTATSSFAADPAAAEVPTDEIPDIYSLGLEDLLSAEVSSVSRRSERLSDTAAAVFVLKGEDILRSGATSIPDALRLVPGLQVAQIGNSRWAVSARGFNGRFANKLLVLVDGRSIYTPLFSGVLWEREDIVLENIERIEVIRGPGAAMWGANAVNGVINIITKKARDTQGGLVALGAGNKVNGQGVARYGAQLGEDTWYRVWGKTAEREPTYDDVDADGSTFGRVGFRLDHHLDRAARLTLNGETYRMSAGDQWNQPDLSRGPGFTRLTTARARFSGGHLRGEYTGVLDDGSDISFSAYFQHERDDEPTIIAEHRDTLDFDFNHHKPLGAHDLMWGVGYRIARSEIGDRTPSFIVRPERRVDRLFSAFAHDDWTLIPERLRLIAGTKLEHNDYTGWEWQPNLRSVWTPTRGDTLWGAVSRAVRTPSRVENESNLRLVTLQPGDPLAASAHGLPLLIELTSPAGTVDRAESVLSYELGYRRQISPALSLDVAGYVSKYAHLRSGRLVGQDCLFASGFAGCATNFPPLLARATYALQMTREATVKGIELASEWHVSERWRLDGSWTALRTETDAPNGDVLAEPASPHFLASLRSSLNLSHAVSFDAVLRHVSRLADDSIPAYTELDMRLAWQARRNLELSLSGQNLLHSRHEEASSDFLPQVRLPVERGYLVQARIAF